MTNAGMMFLAQLYVTVLIALAVAIKRDTLNVRWFTVLLSVTIALAIVDIALLATIAAFNAPSQPWIDWAQLPVAGMLVTCSVGVFGSLLFDSREESGK